MKKYTFIFLFILARVVCLGQLTNGLIFYYPFTNGNDANQAGTAFATILGQGTSPTSDVQGHPNSALAFSTGSGHQQLWVNSGGLIDFGLTTSFSFVSDIKSISSASQWFFRDLVSNGSGWDIGFFNNTGYVTFKAGIGSTAISIRTTTTYNDNAWHQVALIVNKSAMNIKIYVDGIQQNLTGTVCGSTVNGLQIGISTCNFNANEDNAQLTTLGDYMVGALDEIRLYNRLLSLQEVQTLYNMSFIPAPNLVSPSNNSMNINPQNIVLQWGSVPNATGYEVQYDVNASFSSPISVNPTSTNTTISSLNQGTIYYWRVRAVVPTGNSEWSSTWNFKIAEPLTTAPTLVSPANGIGNLPTSSTSLSWNSVSGASGYELHYDVNSTFNFPNILNVTNTIQLLNALSNNTTYYWRVRATNALGNSPFSPTWSFTTAYPTSIYSSFLNPISIFPIPSENEIYVIGLPNKEYNINIFDNLGKSILSKTDNQEKITIDLSSLPEGLYHINIQSGNQRLITTFVKMK